MLYDEILTKLILDRSDKTVESKCYDALVKIKEILEDDESSDAECFYKIEEIVNVFESLGSDCGNRHDFG